MSCQIIHTKNFRLCIWVFLREQEKVYYCLILKKFSANVSLTEMAMPYAHCFCHFDCIWFVQIWEGILCQKLSNNWVTSENFDFHGCIFSVNHTMSPVVTHTECTTITGFKTNSKNKTWLKHGPERDARVYLGPQIKSKNFLDGGGSKSELPLPFPDLGHLVIIWGLIARTFDQIFLLASLTVLCIR